jgi:1,4-dihydroxy-2-naphthoate polyprenyltransferase
MSTSLKNWVAGARPRTLPAAVVPVVVGTAAGYLSSGRFFVTEVTVGGRTGLAGALVDHKLQVINAVLALVVALAIQVGTNFVNDYSDGVRGTDDVRVGPVRLVAGRLATVREVKIAAAAAFAVAGVAGLVLAARVTWLLVPVGIVCVIAGWAYTGGPKPYGYYGFGEIFVFVFFGLVATVGSAYVQHAPYIAIFQGHRYNYNYPWTFAFAAAVPVGFLATGMLQANNLRDLETDTASGKKTLAVRLGRQRAAYLYLGTLMATALSIGVLQHFRGWAPIAFVGMPFSFYPIRLVLSNRTGRKLLPMLGATARLQLVVGILLTVGILL